MIATTTVARQAGPGTPRPAAGGGPGATAEAHDSLERYYRPAEPFELGGFEIRTYLEAAAALRSWVAGLDLDQADLAGRGVPIPEEVARRREEATVFAYALSDGMAEGARLDQGNEADVRALHRDIVRARNAMRTRRVLESDRMRALRAHAADASRIPGELTSLIEGLQAAQHVYFRADRAGDLRKVTRALAAVSVERLRIEAAAEQLRTIEEDARRWASLAAHADAVVSIGGTLAEISKAVTYLGYLHDAVSAIWTSVSLIAPEGVSEAAEARSVVGAWADLTVTGAALTGGAAFTGYFMYVKGLTSAALAKISEIEGYTASQNTAALNAGIDYVNWRVEPGGRPMFDYLVRLKRTPGRAAAPVPRGGVADYLVKHRALLGAGISDAAEVPTTGMWFWREADPQQAATWAFDRRDELWRLLYGDRRVPSSSAYQPEHY